MEVLGASGCDMRRVIIGHCDTVAHDDPALDYEYYHRILETGATVEFDLMGWGDAVNREMVAPDLPRGLAVDAERWDRLAVLVRAPEIVVATSLLWPQNRHTTCALPLYIDYTVVCVPVRLDGWKNCVDSGQVQSGFAGQLLLSTDTVRDHPGRARPAPAPGARAVPDGVAPLVRGWARLARAVPCIAAPR